MYCTVQQVHYIDAPMLETEIATYLLTRHGLRGRDAVRAAEDVLKIIRREHDIVPHSVKRLLRRWREEHERKGD